MSIRRHDGLFKPGTSGNPRGRPPKGESLAEIVRRTVDPHELAQILLSIARNTEAKNSDRIAAVQAIADRGWGRPLSTIDVEARFRIAPSDQGRFAPLSTETLAELAGVVVLDALPPAPASSDEPIDVEGHEIGDTDQEREPFDLASHARAFAGR